MPIPTEGWADLNGVRTPYVVTPDGETRWLSALPVPADHVARFAESYSAYTARMGIPTIPLSDLEPFDRHPKVVSILDQDGHGACVGHAAGAGAMTSVVMSGHPFIDLSAWFSYSNINGGWDRGANPGDAIESLQKDGIAPVADVPYGTIRPAGYSDAARKSALRFRLRKYIQIKTFEEAANCSYYGWPMMIDVQAGGRFNTDDDGFVRFCGRWNNHETLMVSRYNVIKGRRGIGMVNSWTTQWGVNGGGYYDEDFINAAGAIYAMISFFEDPQDPEMPPPLPPGPTAVPTFA